MEVRDPPRKVAGHIPGLQRHDARLVRVPPAAVRTSLTLFSHSEYMLWTDAGSREFIAEHYPWFLDHFDNYKYPIQRADVIRYFVLYHYGGVYIDLDIGCLKPMDPLLIYPVILPKTIPVGVSNDLMFSEKGHPMLEQTIHNLIKFDHSWILNYPTVMFSTGPMFLSAQYGLYTASHPNTALDDIRILPKSLYGKNARDGEAPNSFFSHFYGSSWHADDAAFIGFLGHWGKILMWIGLAILIIGLLRLPSKSGRRFTRGYEVVLPRLSRSGRWHFHLGRRSSFSASGTSTQLPSPVSDDSSPEGGLPVIHLPYEDDLTPDDPYAGRTSSPLVEAFRRVRNRVSSTIHSYQEVPDTPIRPRRGASRGVLFFLPAIFAPAPEIELQAPPPGRQPYRPLARPRGGSSLYPPEKIQMMQEDLEMGIGGGESSGSSSANASSSSSPRLSGDEYTPFVNNNNRHSRQASRSRSSSRATTLVGER